MQLLQNELPAGRAVARKDYHLLHSTPIWKGERQGGSFRILPEGFLRQAPSLQIEYMLSDYYLEHIEFMSNPICLNWEYIQIKRKYGNLSFCLVYNQSCSGKIYIRVNTKVWVRHPHSHMCTIMNESVKEFVSQVYTLEIQ